MIEGVSLQSIMIVSTMVFFIGIYGFLTRSNLIAMLMAIELMINAAAINFVAFNKYLYPEQLQGHIFTLFIITVAAVEVAVAIAIIINLYRKMNSIDADDASEMKY